MLKNNPFTSWRSIYRESITKWVQDWEVVWELGDWVYNTDSFVDGRSNQKLKFPLRCQMNQLTKVNTTFGLTINAVENELYKEIIMISSTVQKSHSFLGFYFSWTLAKVGSILRNRYETRSIPSFCMLQYTNNTF